MNPAYRTLISAGTLAPSGDNMQPWKFIVDEENGQIRIVVDPTRDLSPMNAGQRMARIAVGAAAENLCRTAKHNGWHCEVVSSSEPDGVAIRVAGTQGIGAIDDVVLRRATNRVSYDAREFPHGLLAQLEAIQTPDRSIRIQWIVDRDSIDALAAAVAQADAMMFGNPHVLRAFLANVRFDILSRRPALRGLPVGTLGLSLADRVALRLAPKFPDRLLSSRLMRRTFFVKARQLIESASGVCIVLADDRRETTDFLVGRAFQRAWLQVTSLGLAAQPMMSVPVLDNCLQYGTEVEVARQAPEFAELVAQLARITGASERVAALLRFGFAQAPLVRAGRLPMESVAEAQPSDAGIAKDAAQDLTLRNAGIHIY